MKNLLFILLLLPFCSFSQGSLAALDTKNGYKQIKLGAELTGLGMSKLTAVDPSILDEDGIKNYNYVDANAMHISDNVTLDGISIQAYKGKVFSLVLLFNKTNGEELKKIFTEAYGIPEQNDASVNRYAWTGSDVRLTLNYSGNTNIGLVMYFSNKMSDLRRQDRNSATTKAAADL